jgi:hypothetical protein
MKSFIEKLALAAFVYMCIMGVGMVFSSPETAFPPPGPAPGTHPFNGRVVDPDTQPQVTIPSEGGAVVLLCVQVHHK